MDRKRREKQTADIVDSRPAGSINRLPSQASPPISAGTELGPYRLTREIGAGGFSVVWRAQHSGTGDVVAIKLPRVAEFVNHLRREALISSRFQDPQVVGIKEVCLDHEPPYLVMPYVAGANLEMPSAPPGPAEIVVALRRFREVVKVVARLHEAGIVHGDLKPGNLRIDEQGWCHVLDLGLARHQVTTRQKSTLRASVMSVTGEKIAGTLEFMAPEVLSGDRPGTPADVYALGITLHTMLCGRPPAFGVSPSELNPYLPPGMTDFLRQMLHPDPAHRPPTAVVLIPALDRFIAVEEACLRRRNGHARRLVFRRRMRILARGISALGWIALAVLLVGVGLPAISEIVPRGSISVGVGIGLIVGVYLFFLGMVMGITTINAWILRIPEKTYKNRAGHPWWTFMMR